MGGPGRNGNFRMGNMRDTSNMGDQVGMARFHMGDMKDTSNMGDQVGMARFHMGDMRDTSNMGGPGRNGKVLHGGT